MFKEGDIVEMVRDCTNGSPTGKGSIGRISHLADPDVYRVNFPSDNDWWHIKVADMQKKKLLFPKKFNGYKFIRSGSY